MVTAKNHMAIESQSQPRAEILPRPATHALARGLILAAALVVTLPGCYRHVVSARGFGAETVDVHTSGRSDTPLDRMIDPPQRSTRLKPMHVERRRHTK